MTNISENSIINTNLIQPDILFKNKTVSQTNIKDPQLSLDNTKDNIKINNITSEGKSVITNLSIISEHDKSKELPPIKETIDNLSNGKSITRYTNTYGITLSVMKTKEDRITYTISCNDLYIILTHNKNSNRDTLCFSDMGENVPRNSMIPNTYFHLYDKEKESKIYFDKNHDVVIELRTGEKLVLNGENFEVKEGNFNIKMSPNKDGKGFKVNYRGKDLSNIKKYTSFGDNVLW